MTTDRKNLGQILVANGTITEKTLERALSKAKREGKRIGAALEEMGVATGEEVAEALAEQFRCKTVRNFAGYSYPPELLKLLPVDTATRFFLFPLRLENNALYLAMADPTDTRVVANLATNNKLTIVPFIASRREILAAINRHYLGKVADGDRRPTVLIVEDNSATCTELEQVLAREGFRTITAKNGIEAFKKALCEGPGVIVTDKEMPVFDGYMLLNALQSLPETMRIPVILITGSEKSTEESEALDKGFFDYLAKPVRDVSLVSRVKRALRSVQEC